jgi:RimJ/RimL family protein N-acetyltransferase
MVPRSVPATGVALEPFGPADYGHLVAWIPDEAQLLQWPGPIFRWPLDDAQLDAYRTPTVAPEPTRLIWRAVTSPDGALVGHVELNEIDRRHLAASLSRVLVSPEHRDRGVGRAMAAAVLEAALGALGLHRVELRVFDFNEPAIRCREALGFRREGFLRDKWRVGNEYWNALVMSLLDDEWRRRKES